jgi:two-component system, LytTR family, response regulator LytT
MEFKVAILDDEAIYRNIITKELDKMKASGTLNIQYTEFEHPDLLIEKLKNQDAYYHLLLLDICMDDKNGIETAKIIRQYDYDFDIVFITSSKDYVFDGYDVNASGYLIKPIDSKTLNDIILKTYQKVNKKSYISLKNKGEIRKVNLNDIMFFESNKRQIIVNTVDEKIITYGKIADYDYLTDAFSFIIPHKSYLVNMHHIENIIKRQIQMMDKQVVPISKNNLDPTKKSFLFYLNNSK